MSASFFYSPYFKMISIERRERAPNQKKFNFAKMLMVFCKFINCDFKTAKKNIKQNWRDIKLVGERMKLNLLTLEK